MDRLIPVFVVILIILLGFIRKWIELYNINKKIDFTTQYHQKYILFLNNLFENKYFDRQLYNTLTYDVNEMQYELGLDGVYAYVEDRLNNFSTTNYPALLNFIPELSDFINNTYSHLMMNRYRQLAQNCDNMFIRHLGSLNSQQKSIKKNIFNPFSCLAEGIRFIISLPILILNWLGLISNENTDRVKHSWIVRFINFIIVLIGLIGSIMSITLGWSDFQQKIYQLISIFE